MTILLSNDDGYFSEGIKVLEEVLVSYGHTIYVVAPSTQQSAKSHSMTIGSDFILHRLDDHHYHLEGTPVDCIMCFQMADFLGIKPDVIIGGINHGTNLSTDILYSGTCGIARQGTMYGIKSIAVSCQHGKNGGYRFHQAAEFLAKHLDDYVAQIPKDAFLSLNFPYEWDGTILKAEPGFMTYEDHFQMTEEGDTLRLVHTEFLEGYREEYLGSGNHPIDHVSCRLGGKATATLLTVIPGFDEAGMASFRV